MATSPRAWEPVAPEPGIPAPKGAYTPVVRAGPFLFVSGQVPRDPLTGALHGGGDVQSQTRHVMDNVRRALATAGASLSDIVSVTAYLANADDWDAFNEAYRSILTAPYPARTTVGADLRGILVEISVVAYVGTGERQP